MNIDNEIRPLIRIEIQNDIATNSMDVDPTEDDGDEAEDGEISDNGLNNDENQKIDDVENDNAPTNIANINLGNKWWNKEGGFMTGVDVFAEDELNKLNVRAKRFGITNTESKAIAEHQIQDLYSSLRLNPSDEKLIRFDAVHMRGVEEMSTKDVFGYFSAYGPSSIEWINDYSCNVVWLDNVSAARALLGLSKKISGFEYLDEDNPFILKEVSNTPTSVVSTSTKKSTRGRSILLIQQDDEEEKQEVEATSKKTLSTAENNELWELNEVIDLTDIPIPIPPGYWRYGKPHPKAKAILLRYAFKTDKKPFKAEKLSGYYKKYGNPNYGGLKGLISESRKKQIRGNFKITREVRTDPTNQDDTIELDNKNPWGILAKSWGNEDRGVEFNEPKEIVLPRLQKDEPQKVVPITTNLSIRERLGVKRKVVESSDEGNSQNATDAVAVEKRSKVPRMRMYADEEQERLNRLKLTKMARQRKFLDVDNQGDLRNRLLIKSNKQVNATATTMPFLPHLKIEVSRDDNFETLENKTATRTFENRQSNSRQTYSSDDEDNNLRYKRKSTVKVVIRNIPKPTIASTVSRQNVGHSQKPAATTYRLRKLSDREQFRSESYNNDELMNEPTTNVEEDLRDKISTNRAYNKRPLKVHTTNSKLFRNIKKESSSESNESSDSDAESSDSSNSSTSSSQSESSASDHEKEPPASPKHTSILRKTASSVSSSSGPGEIDKNIKGSLLRIEVPNDNYNKNKSVKSALKIEVKNDNYSKKL